MPVTGFFNDNANRSYPFVSDRPQGYTNHLEFSSSSGDSWSSISSSSAGYALPSNAIVDFGCTLGVESGFSEGVDSVYLYGVARAGNFLMFEFRCTDAAMASHNLIFMRNVDEAENTIEYVDATAQGIPGSNFPSSLSFSDVVAERLCDTRPLWDGYLITGDLTDLAAQLNLNGDVWYAPGVDASGASELKVEPALTQNLGKTYLRSVSLANEARTKTTPYESCSSSESIGSDSSAAIDYGASSSDCITNATCLSGPLVFREGYNCSIIQSTFDNSLSFSANKTSGAGEPCEEVSLSSDEARAEGSRFLSGGPSCFDLLNSINGVFGSGLTPSVLSLIAGPGIRIKPTDGVPHSLDVIFDLRDFTVCIAPPTESSQSLSSIDGSSSSSSSSSGSTSSSSSSSVSSSSSSATVCLCGQSLYANSPYGSEDNSSWLLVTDACDSNGVAAAPTYAAAPGTEVWVCCECVASSSSISSSSSSSVSLSSSSSAILSSSSSSSLSVSEEICEDCSECDSKGYAIFAQSGWVHNKPFIPDYGINGDCGPCWNNCCDGNVPPEVGSLDMVNGEAVNCNVAGTTFAKFCCETAPPSSCSACDGEAVGWVLWQTDMNAAGWPNNKTWSKTPLNSGYAGAWPECCTSYDEVTPSPAASPNYTPTFTYPPGFKFRKECCVCGNEPFPLAGAALTGPGDYSCACTCGWSFWTKSPLAVPGPWDLYAGHCTAGCSDAMPAYDSTPGAEIVDAKGWGVDSIVVATCCT